MSPGFIDVLLGGALAFFALKGLFTGLVKSLVTIVAVVVAWFAMNTFPLLTAPVLGMFMNPQDPAFLLAAKVATLIVAYMVVQLVGFFVTGLIERVGLSPVDKLGGLALGVATGVLFGCLPLVAIYSIPQLYHWDKTQSTIAQSFFLSRYTPIVRNFVKPPAQPR